jgi:hypothetical protein
MIRRIGFAVSLSAAIFIGIVPPVNPGQAETPMKEVASIAGTTLKVIEAASAKLKEQNLKLEDYLVSVFEKDTAFLVLFTDPEQPTGHRGSTTSSMGFEVEISKTGLRAVRANFMR